MEGGKKIDNKVVDQEISGFSIGKANENKDIVFKNRGVAKENKKDKLIGFFLIITAISAVGIGFFTLSSSIIRPNWMGFIGDEVIADLSGNCSDGSCDLNSDLLKTLELQNKDTDGDGLSDYDELYIYKTSPYLEDSDSDGYLDKEEIDKGFDPNCPGTESCFRDDNANDGDVEVPRFSSSPPAFSIGQQQMTPNEIRQLLIQGGVTTEELAGVSDADLIALFNETSGGSVGLGGGVGQAQTVDTATAIEGLQNMTGAQIRVMLLKQPDAPVELLNQLSDEELKTMFLEQINME